MHFRHRVLGASFGLCLFATASHADQTVLKFWDNQQTPSGLSDIQREAVARFEAENPDIKVEVTTIPFSEYQQRLLTAVQAGNGPDVSTVDQIWVSPFATAGVLQPLDDLIAHSSVKPEDYFKGGWDSVTYDGHVWGIPFNAEVWFFAYVNKTLFKEAGIDPASIVSWPGLEAAAKALTDKSKGQYGIGLVGAKHEYTNVITNSFIFSNGGSIVDDNGKCALSSPETVGALKYYAELAQYAPAGLLNALNEPNRELFLNGKLAIELWPTLEQNTLQNSSIDWDMLTGFAPEGKTPIGEFGGWNIVIYKQSKNLDAAWKFVEFMTRADVNGKVVDLIPANIAAADEFLKEKRKYPEAILEHLKRARQRPLLPDYLQIAEIQETMVQKILTGTPAEQAASEACAAIDAL